MGICNGFQILTEAQMLPGALIRNDCVQFRCKWVNIRVENANTPFTYGLKEGEVLRIPIAHAEGNYIDNPEKIAALKASKSVVFRYCSELGEITPESNPNGAMDNIAGIVNARGNILGMMPHPERACENALGSDDGMKILGAVAGYIHSRVAH